MCFLSCYFVAWSIKGVDKQINYLSIPLINQATLPDQTNTPVTALILEQNSLIANDLKNILSKLVEKVYIANCYNNALKITEQFPVDLCLCDINLDEEKTGICFAKEVKKQKPNTQIIYLSAHSDEKTLNKLACTEPLFFVVKPYIKQQIIASVKLSIATNNNKIKHTTELNKLTSKEQRILFLISQNKNSKGISNELYISEKTVRNHRYNILKKLDLSKEKNTLLLFAIKMFP